MISETTCESCTMPIESGRYCAYCTDEHGQLQDFETRFQAMLSWQRHSNPDAPLEQLEAETRAYMAKMPAWRDHPKLQPRA